LPGDLADAVARRLVAASLEEDPALAYRHAQAARRLAARVGIVRETAGIAAYRAGQWADALTELRAARRLTGRESRDVDQATAIELRIVESGIRRDQGLSEAAVVALQIPELTNGRAGTETVRLFYAYADALLDAGREDEARDWFARAAAADVNDETDAAERLEQLDPVTFDYLDDPEEPEEPEEPLTESSSVGP
jgi:hypothetical protein